MTRLNYVPRYVLTGTKAKETAKLLQQKLSSG